MQSSLDARSKSMLQLLVESDGYVTIDECKKQLGVSRRSIYYDLSKINQWCADQSLPFIQVERNRGFYLTDSQKYVIAKEIIGVEVQYRMFQPQERVGLIICFLLAQRKFTFIEELAKICDVSRNTVFKDLKQVRVELEQYNLELQFEPHVGYQIRGESLQRWSVFMYYLSEIMDLIKEDGTQKSSLLNFCENDVINDYQNILYKIEEMLNVNYVDGFVESLSILMSVISNRDETYNLNDINLIEIYRSQEFECIEKFFENMVLQEKVYLCMHLLGARVQVPLKEKRTNQALQIAVLTVNTFEKIACIEFEEKEQLIDLLAYHFQTSLYRYRYGIQMGNPLLKDIENNYADIYSMTKRVMAIVVDVISLPIPASEIAYIAMHFGGFIHRTKSNKVKICIVCPNGLSTASILQSEIQNLHSNIEIVASVSMKEMFDYYGKVHFIVSTIDFDAFVPVIKVNAILSDADKERLLSIIFNEGDRYKSVNVTVNKILKVVGEYLNDTDYQKVRMSLISMFNTNENHEIKNKSIQLIDLLSLEDIQYKKKCKSWTTAIQDAAEPLRKANKISDLYVERMIERVHEYGSYIVLTPELALAHALPSDGVFSLGLSLLVLREPVNLKGKQPRCILVLAPIDKQAHLGVMKDILHYFNNIEFVEKLLICSTTKEIHNLFIEYQANND